MTAIAIRQSGGANIISIPKAIVQSLGLHVGSRLELSIEHDKIVLTPIKKEPPLEALEALLVGSPKECFRMTEEDREWVNAKPVGREI